MVALDEQQPHRKLERVQNRVLRLITGQSMSSPYEALRAEAKVNSMRCVIRQNITKSREKALRLPEDHSRRVAFEGVCRFRLKRRDARSEAEDLYKELGKHDRAPFEVFTFKSWEKGLGKVSVLPALSGVSGMDDNVDTIRIVAEKRAIEIGADFNVYTDGSASGGLMDGGAGVVVTRGNSTSTTERCPLHLFL